MIDKQFHWYPWEPGGIPYLERISPEARGLLWIWADDYWRGSPVPSPHVFASDEAIRVAESCWPALKQLLDSHRARAEEKAKAKHINAVNANRIRWGSEPDPNGIRNHPREEKSREDKTRKDKKQKPPKEKKQESLFPIRDSMDPDLADWYLEAVAVYPTKDEGHNARSGMVESRRVQRDSPQAQKNFAALVASGAVTARELYVCSWLAATAWAKQRDNYNYIPNLSSFFSSGEKAPWANWIEEARETINSQEVEA